MARQAITPSAVLTIPGAYSSWSVQANPSGFATSGVLVLIGEAAEGPAFSQETSLANTFYGPNQLALIQSKYGSGNLVDAARIASQAAKDTDLQGAPTGFYLLKTNVGGQASRSLLRSGLTPYGTIYDVSYGTPGNLISTVITNAPAEIAPAVTFTYMPVPGVGSGGSEVGLRVNGGAGQTLNIVKQSTPATVVGSVASGSATGLNGLTGVLATGGVNQSVLSGFTAGVSTLTLVASGLQVTITGSVAWTNIPAVGSTLVIPGNATFGAGQNSCLDTSANNLGLYIVNSATATQIVATKIYDAADVTSPPSGPVTTVAETTHSDATDILVYSPVTLQNATGVNRNFLAAANVGATLAGAAVGQTLTLTMAIGSGMSGVWAAQPTVGDFLYLASTAPSAMHASGANGGFYQVTASTTTTVTLLRLSNGAPVTFAATAIAAITDWVCSRPAIDGIGKSLEIYDMGAAINVNTSFLTSTGGPVAWLSTSVLPAAIYSSAELQVQIINSQTPFSETLNAGGDLMLQIGYAGTTASVTITATTLTTSVTGGIGANLSLTLKQYGTVAALAAYINSMPGYVCQVSNNALGQTPLMNGIIGPPSQSVLDQGTFNCCSQNGIATLSIKRDAYDFWYTLYTNSQLVKLGTGVLGAPATAGLPPPESLAYLSGGSVGGTSNANVLAALAKAQTLRLNGVVPLFSADATSDVTNELTDASSTYTIAAINANTLTHVLAMSNILARRNRQAYLSFSGSFAAAQAAAQNIASFRASMCFENFVSTNSSGNLVTFQPWAGAVYAAAMQMVGFYRSIMAKGINCSGVLPVDSSFDPNDDTAVTEALQAGLLPAQALENGGYAWVSDQTTYSTDPNFVFNSIQTVYASDLVSLTVAQRMQAALVGQSLADVSASSGAGIFASIMVDMKRLKLLSSSSDAPAGYKNLVINVVNDTMYVSAEIKTTQTLAFAPIALTVSQITQSA